MNRSLRHLGRPSLYDRTLNTCLARSFQSSRWRRPAKISSYSNPRYTQFRQFSLLRPKFRGVEWSWPQLSGHVVRNEPVILAVIVVTTTLVAAGIYRRAKRKELLRRLGPYPPKVGIALNRAIYFTEHEEDPAKAIEAFITALKAASDHGMDPLSNEVLGIRTELAKSLEKYGNLTSAANVLEDLKSSCLEWINEHGQDPNASVRRTKLLSWACRISTRLGDLYSQPQIRDEKKMEQSLVWAVETTLKEKQRLQQQNGANNADPSSEWLDDDEIGSQLENLAHMYEERDEHFYASQLFLNALNMKPKKDCHAVILMNNLAASMAQQSPPAEPGIPPTSQSQLRESGKAWALQALALSQSIKGGDRNEECNIGCVVATHNLGEFAEMDGNVSEARERYAQAANLAHAYGFEEGVVSANEGLKRVAR